MLKVGLTGSIGTGKTTVLNLFKELGAYVISADQIVHQLLKRKDIKEKIKKEFGNVFTSEGEIDRKKLAQIVFKDEKKRKKLESIIHPEVFKELENFFKSVDKKDPDAVAVAEIPLMIETGSYKNYDIVIVVYAPEEIQIERLKKKGMKEDEILRRIRSQMPIDEKIKYADIVIKNTGSIDQLKKEVENVYKKLKNFSNTG
ncbi:dephospho-CoA kinase [Persephonella sp.]|uniref:dephospho-CoA kinase n=1 Tax=Persephonella sp. TaxID=2060922 RepID=UPI0025E629ED|nr:dephospho-CoA kinase [Persephonella sp.]